jgi:hypothetical protein
MIFGARLHNHSLLRLRERHCVTRMMTTIVTSAALRSMLKRITIGVGLGCSLRLTVLLGKYRAFAAMASGDLAELFGHTQSDGHGIVTEEMLEGFPRRCGDISGIPGSWANHW